MKHGMGSTTRLVAGNQKKELGNKNRVIVRGWEYNRGSNHAIHAYTFTSRDIQVYWETEQNQLRN